MTDLAIHPYSSHAPVFSVDATTEGRLGRDLLRVDIDEGPLGLRTMAAHFQAIGPDSDGSTERLSYLDGDPLGLGSTIDVNLGPPGGERQVFHGRVSAIEVSFAEGASPVVTVFAEDALMRLRLAERTATYTRMSDADIVGEVVRAHGLSSEVDLDGPTYSMVQQWEESDLAFIRDRALRLDAEVWADHDDVIHVATRERRPGIDLLLVQGNELIEIDARMDLAHQRTRIEYRGWDDMRVEAVSAEASADLIRGEIASGRIGPDLVADVFDQTSIRRSRRDVLAADAAQAYADAEMRRRARSFVSVEGTTAGSPDLVPGTRLDLRRVGPPFEGDGYRVTSAHHSYDTATGYRTRFRAERPQVAS